MPLTLHRLGDDFRMLEDDPPAVEPDVLVETRSEDYFSGQGAILVRALKD